MMKIERTSLLTAALVAVSLVSTGCGDALRVSNPGLIADASLDDAAVFGALVTGISGDYSVALNISREIAEMTDDQENSSFQILQWHLGHFEPDLVNPWWRNMQTARWVAEDGIRRMKDGMAPADFAKSALVARAQLFAGLANRLLGENVCYAVIDGGKAQPRAEHFKRAEAHFTAAMATAQAAGASAASLYTAALGGRASVKAWQGNWDGAVQDAAQVPTSFVYQALYGDNTARENNSYWQGSFGNWYLSMDKTSWIKVGMDLEKTPRTGDPRIPYKAVRDPSGGIITTRSGIHKAIAQMKYPDLGSDKNVVAGTEMLVLRAEAALRKKDIAGMTALLNANRAYYGMTPVAVPATEADAWDMMSYERAATLWLEGRRYWDLTRWYAEGHAFVVNVQGDAMESMAKRDRCMPIALAEMESNPNLKGFTGL
jgi:starch-binding outer membrane protein, SusD/RagB family